MFSEILRGFKAGEHPNLMVPHVSQRLARPKYPIPNLFWWVFVCFQLEVFQVMIAHSQQRVKISLLGATVQPHTYKIELFYWLLLQRHEGNHNLIYTRILFEVEILAQLSWVLSDNRERKKQNRTWWVLSLAVSVLFMEHVLQSSIGKNVPTNMSLRSKLYMYTHGHTTHNCYVGGSQVPAVNVLHYSQWFSLCLSSKHFLFPAPIPLTQSDRWKVSHMVHSLLMNSYYWPHC